MAIGNEDLKDNPYLTANFFSKLVFWWITPLFKVGYKKKLGPGDVYKVLPSDSSEHLGKELAQKWEAELRRCYIANVETKKIPKLKPSLGKVIVQQFQKPYILIGILAFIEECFIRIVQPICLGFLIRYFDGNLSKTHGHLLAGAIVVTSIFYTFTHHPFFFGVQHLGMQVRVGCCALLYRKALRLSQAALCVTTVGQMVNLLANDVTRFDQSTIFLHYLWIAPVQTLIVTGILWHFFGPCCLVGIGVLILFMPLQGYMGKVFSDLRTATAIKTDSRVRIMNEILNGIRVIKMYTWETAFSTLVDTARKDEVNIIRKASYLRSINVGIFYVSSKIVVFLTLVVYTLTGNSLTAEKVFVTLALINNARTVMTVFFPSAISFLAETLVSINRLEKFLLLEERNEELFLDFKRSEKERPFGGGDQDGPLIILKHFSAKWNPDNKEDTLMNINFSVGPKELVCLIGQVGSGKVKGSILHAILKELPGNKGSVIVRGSIAYASQDAWLFGGTIKENILFGSRLVDENWYQEVIEACALTKDFEMLPNGDMTLVGDRGTGLSGGQRARICLARAVFSNRDIYLLDDPLSAVDAEVGRHLFEKCINGILKNKLRILVTHQVQFLKKVERIFLMNEGVVKAKGNYSDIIESGMYMSVDSEPSLSYSNFSVGTSMSSLTTISPFGSHSRVPLNATSVSQITSTFLLRRRESVNSAEGSMMGQVVQNDEVESMGAAIINPGHQRSMSEAEADSKSKDLEDVGLEGGAAGHVKWKTYYAYFRAGSGWLSFSILIATNVLTMAVFTGSDYWLQFWTRGEQARAKRTPDPKKYSKADKEDRDFQLILYSVIIGVLIILSVWRALIFFQISMRASVNLHAGMFQGIIRAPIRFFELTPIGRILNRFSRDVGNTDESIPPIFMDAIGILLTVIGVVIIIAVVNPILLVPAILLVVMFYFLRRYYMFTAREIKRLEAIARSPVFSHLSSTLNGLTTIRSFGTQAYFIRQFDQLQDLHSASWFLFIASTRWFGVWLDWISIFYIAAVTYSFMFDLTIGKIDGAEVGFTISTVMMLTGMFQWGVRQSTEVENQMISVERILEYTEIESEAPLESDPGKGPSKKWPSHGEIILSKVSLKYGEITTLRNINCHILAGEKVGIVGRSGAGKSSLINALFRIVEPSGVITIDNLNILEIGLHDLRSKLSIIPQEPVLFEGTLRHNLDPFSRYEDVDLWKVIKDLALHHHIKLHNDGLNQKISEDGKNFSTGSKQLICIARAILKQNRIIVLDEATANVDTDTDAHIQKSIRTMFRKCTVITVAHRLNTVMDADRILVLSNGSVQEFDEPWSLLQDPESALYQLVEQTGKQSMEQLFHIAKWSHNRRRSLRQITEKLGPAPDQ